jgi:hypothetical protein
MEFILQSFLFGYGIETTHYRKEHTKLRPSAALALGSTDDRRRQLDDRSTAVACSRQESTPYSGISQSGNHRETSSSHGSSFPTWDFRRSSRSLSRACSPFAGTNG